MYLNEIIGAVNKQNKKFSEKFLKISNICFKKKIFVYIPFEMFFIFKNKIFFSLLNVYSREKTKKGGDRVICRTMKVGTNSDDRDPPYLRIFF